MERPRIRLEEVDDGATPHESVGFAAGVAVTGQSRLPVGCEQPERVPAFTPPPLREAAPVEKNVLLIGLRQAMAEGETGLAGADDQCPDLLNGHADSSSGTTTFPI